MKIRRLMSLGRLAVLLLLSLSACSGGGGGSSGSGPSSSAASFSLSLDSSNLSAPQGAEVLLKVNLTRNAGFTDPVSITLNQPPAGLVSDMVVLPSGVTGGSMPITVGSGVATGAFPITVVAQAGGQSATVSMQLTVVPPDLSSQEKIAAAVAAGSLEYGTSLLYRAYALYNDKRLPEAYRGFGFAGEDTGLFTEIHTSLASLPANLQAELRPFIVRPADPQSVWSAPAGQRPSSLARVAAVPPPASSLCPSQSSAWISKRSTAYPVRVWARCVGEPAYDADSEHLLDLTLGLLNKIYEPMANLMGPPILDEEGGDNAIDVYIIDPDTYVYRSEQFFATHPVDAGTNGGVESVVGNASSAFIVVPRYAAFCARFHLTLIHEFFHVLQFAHNLAYAGRYQANVPVSGLKEKHWFPEASATWAAVYWDRVLAPWEGGRYAGYEHERLFVPIFQQHTFALNDSHPFLRQYAAYIWPYFVEQDKGGPQFMKEIWDRLKSVTTFEQADDAIDSVYSFAEHFKQFALRNLNTEFTPGDPLPKAKRYVNLDPEHFPDRKEPPYIITGNLVADQESNQTIDLPNLSARYVRLVINQSTGIQKVELDFSGLQPVGFTDVQALVQTVGGWVSQPLDLGSGRVTFCFDQGPTTVSVRGSFDEIVLIISNHDKRLDNKVTGSLRIRPQSTPCAPVWEGMFTHTLQGPAGTNWTATMTASVVFEPVPGPFVPGSQEFRVRSGNYNFVEKIVGTCTLTRTASGPMLPSLTDPAVPGHVFGGFVVTPRPDLSAGYLGQGLTTVEESWVEVCPDYTHQGKILQGQLWWSMFLQPGETSRPLAPDLSPDGKTIKGFAEKSDIGGGVFRSEWQLQLKEE